jgi:RNA polymerase sigma-70 factor, ECF subfamily
MHSGLARAPLAPTGGAACDEASPSSNLLPTMFASARRRAPTSAELRAFVLEHHAFTWRMIRRLGVPESSVDDGVQQVFLVLTRRLADVEPEKERSFLVSTILRVAANMRRSQARVLEDPWNDEPPEIASNAPTPEESLCLAERRALLDAVLAPLPLELRTVFVLAELEGMTAPEIAPLVAAPVGTVTSRLRRARELVERHVRLVKARCAGGGGR